MAYITLISHWHYNLLNVNTESQSLRVRVYSWYTRSDAS